MQPVCVPCRTTMRCEKNDFCVVTESDGKPYQAWLGDKWKCPKCGMETVLGFGRGPIAECFEDDFAEHCADLDGFQIDIDESLPTHHVVDLYSRS